MASVSDALATGEAELSSVRQSEIGSKENRVVSKDLRCITGVWVVGGMSDALATSLELSKIPVSHHRECG